MKTLTLVPQRLELQQSTQEEKLSLPVMLKDKILLSPGEWNGFTFSAESIRDGFNLTDWTDKQNCSLIYDHDERAVNWLGWVKNIRVDSDGAMLGDLEVWDEDLARKLKLAGAKLGISARVMGIEDEGGNFEIKSFANFSVVYDPACKNAYINLSSDKERNKFEELEKRIEKLEGITSSGSVQGSGVGAKSNEKIKNDPDKRKKEEEKKEKAKMEDGLGTHPDKMKKKKKKEEDKEKTSHLYRGKGGEDLMTKEDIQKEQEISEAQETSEEETPTEESSQSSESEGEKSEESQEEKSEGLSSKLDLVLSEIEKISKRVANLEKSGDDSSSEEKSAELSKKEKDVKPLSNASLDKKIPRGYTQGDSQFVEALLSQASLK